MLIIPKISYMRVCREGERAYASELRESAYNGMAIFRLAMFVVWRRDMRHRFFLDFGITYSACFPRLYLLTCVLMWE